MTPTHERIPEQMSERLYPTWAMPGLHLWFIVGSDNQGNESKMPISQERACQFSTADTAAAPIAEIPDSGIEAADIAARSLLSSGHIEVAAPIGVEGDYWTIFRKARDIAALKVLGDDDKKWATPEQAHAFEVAGLEAVAKAATERAFKITDAVILEQGRQIAELSSIRAAHEDALKALTTIAEIYERLEQSGTTAQHAAGLYDARCIARTTLAAALAPMEGENL